jgi:hypothetical protein
MSRYVLPAPGAAGIACGVFFTVALANPAITPMFSPALCWCNI